jgi:rubrerythrin
LEISDRKPERCPVCGADGEKFVKHEISGIRGERTAKNLQEVYAAESKAHQRNLVFALKADQEGYSQIARLFRAVAEAEGVHAYNSLQFLDAISDTQENLHAAFERENLASSAYPRFVIEANEDGDAAVARIFSFVRDVEREHAKLYEKALERTLADTDTDYYVCGICGYVSDGVLPDKCPICGAAKDRFKHIV